jgi:hypothetical protein
MVPKHADGRSIVGNWMQTTAPEPARNQATVPHGVTLHSE